MPAPMGLVLPSRASSRRGPFTVAYVPLDDRPVNLDAVIDLAHLSGAEVLVPPPEMLGSFTTPGDPAALSGWVQSLPAGVAHLVVSLDMLCHGGLLASRRAPEAADAEAAARACSGLAALEALRAAQPRLPISALGVLLRSSISVTDDGHLDLWRRVHEAATRETATAAAMPCLMREAGVPEDVARAYLATRQRNLTVHRQAIELVRRDVIDYLLLCQEDAAPAGIHREEQLLLAGLIEEAGLGGRVLLQPGADEGGMLLFARAALRRHKLGLAVQPHFGPGGAGAIGLYEDCSLFDSLSSKLAALRGRRGFGTHLYLHVLEGEPDDLFLLAHRGDEFTGFTGELPAIRPGWAVADVSCANGADPQFVGRLLEQVPPLALASFAAWNTASNALGCVLAHLACREIGLQVLPARDLAREHTSFLAGRFADDLLYQAQVRPRLLGLARKEGLTAFDLGEEGWQRMQAHLETEMQTAFDEFWQRQVLARPTEDLAVRSVRARFSLPWPRLFEARARVRVEVE